MKLAEALLLRADMQKHLASLQERISRNVLVQEGEKPSEDPNELLKQANDAADRLQKLIFAINQSNLSVRTRSDRSLTEALSERDILELKHSTIVKATEAATMPPERYSVKEIRWIKVVDVEKLQKEADHLAKTLREVNAEIQMSNWDIEISGIEV